MRRENHPRVSVRQHDRIHRAVRVWNQEVRGKSDAAVKWADPRGLRMIVVLPLHWPIRFDLNRQPFYSRRNVAVVGKYGQNDSVDTKCRARDSWYLVEFIAVVLPFFVLVSLGQGAKTQTRPST